MKHQMQNRLAKETSPYLQQHAHNPVDWFPWCDEAFEKAKREDKPIFLSIGYSTCHWCHVMAHESFEDEEVANLLNRHFICIKVDREERPDIDRAYMKVAQMMIGHGGWPLTIFMSPDKTPFFAATYIPKYASYGRHGMLSLLPAIVKLWKNHREKVLEIGNSIKKAILQKAPFEEQNLPSEIFDVALEHYLDTFDSTWGGFGQAPKFPAPHNLMFLLRYWRNLGDERALEMVEKTLVAMRRGGIFDQIGFGFHRYSTDTQWKVPHFEKMLYDQALQIMVYTEAYLATGKKVYAKVVDEIVQYLVRALQSSEGGFFSAEDADSEGSEGRYYLWSVDEISELLTDKEFQVICKVFNIDSEGNFEEEGTRRKTGLNIFYRSKSYNRIAWELDESIEVVEEIVESARQKLFKARETREHPFRDEKILADWNGLIIAALAKAGAAINEQFTKIAEKVFDFVKNHLISQDLQIHHAYTAGQVTKEAFLDDYAFLIWGLIELYEATFDPNYLRLARDLHNKMIKQFGDPDEGGLFFTSIDSEEILAREKIAYDGAIPSGNSIAAWNGVRLARLLGNPDIEQGATSIIKRFAKEIEQNPVAHAAMLLPHSHIQGPAHEMLIVGASENTKELLKEIRSWFLPETVILLKTEEHEEALSEIAPFTKEYPYNEQEAMVYICTGQTCSSPTKSINEIKSLLRVP